MATTSSPDTFQTRSMAFSKRELRFLAVRAPRMALKNPLKHLPEYDPLFKPNQGKYEMPQGSIQVQGLEAESKWLVESDCGFRI